MKIILASFLAALILLLQGARLNGQQNVAFFKATQLSRKSIATEHPAIRESEVEIRVVRRFVMEHPSAESEAWSRLGNRYVVRFHTGSVKHKIVYSKRGSEEYWVKMYSEENLSRRIRARVMSIYYDYDIKTVQELRVNSKIIHLVRLCGAERWKLVRISEDEFDEIESLVKS